MALVNFTRLDRCRMTRIFYFAAICLYLLMILITQSKSSSVFVSAQTSAASTTTAEPPLDQTLSAYFSLNLTAFPGPANFSIALASVLQINTLDMAYSYRDSDTVITMFFTNTTNRVTAHNAALALTSSTLSMIGALAVAQGTTTTTTSAITESAPTEKPLPDRDVGVVIGAIFGWICLVIGLVFLWKRSSNRRVSAREATANGEDVERNLATEQSLILVGSQDSGVFSGGGRLEEPTLNEKLTLQSNNASGGTNGLYRQLEGEFDSPVRQNKTQSSVPNSITTGVGIRPLQNEHGDYEDDGSSVL